MLQVCGYAALLTIYAHSDVSQIVTALQRLPVLLVAPLALFGFPSVVAAGIIGVPLAAVGLPPAAIPAILLARGDLLVFLSAYAISVAGVWGARRMRS